MKDSISISRIAQLHPKVRTIFQNFIEECEKSMNITLRIMMPVYRTIPQQKELYKIGRYGDKKPIVTNANGGQSYHNYGLAIDLCRMSDDGKEVLWDFDMKKLTPIADKYEIQWGGDWQSVKDRPHFQISFGLTWQQLFALYNAKKVDKQGYVLI